jgi:hypothetical protein
MDMGIIFRNLNMANAFNLTAQLNLQGPANVKAVVAGIRKDLKGLNLDLKVNIDSKAQKTVKDTTAALKQMNDVLYTAKNNAAALNASLGNLSKGFGAVGKGASKLNNSVNQTTKSMRGVASVTIDTSNKMELLGKSARNTAKRFLIYASITRVFYGFTSAVNSAFKRYLEFDKQIIRLQQVTKSGAIGLSGLTKEIDRLSTTLGISSEKLTQTAVTLAQAGISANDAKIALEALAKTELAPTFDDISRTTEGAIAALRQFSLETNQLESVLSSINAVAGQFAVEASDIIAAIQRTGGVFAAASKGVENLDGSLKTGEQALQEFVAVFTSVRATTRESAETIATGLRTIFTRIQRGSTIEFLKQFNIELQDVEGNFVGPYEAVRRLAAGLKDLDPRDVRFTRIVEELGGFRQIGKVIPLLQNFADAERALAAAQAGTQSLEGDRLKGLQSLAVQFARVNEQAFSLFKTIGDSKVFRGFLSVILSLSSGLLSLAKTFKPILPLLAILGTIKVAKSAFNIASGAAGAIKAGGGSKGVGRGIGNALTGGGDKKDTKSTVVITQNTAAIKSLTNAVLNLTNRINRSPGTTGFASGGIVPGSGNRDTVPAMLTPGEFVIRKDAVKALGTEKLHKMNKYGSGGKIKDEAAVGSIILEYEKGRLDNYSISKEELTKSANKKKGEYDSQVLKDIKNRSKGYEVIRSSFGNEFVYKKFNDAINHGLISGVNSSIAELQKNFGPYSGLTGIDMGANGESIRKTFYDSINDAARGNMFESIFQAAAAGGGKFTGGPRDFWDFQNGLGSASGYFEGMDNVRYIEARASGARAIASKIIPKILNQIGLENGTKEDPNKPSDPTSGTLAQAQQDNIMQLLGGSSTPLSLNQMGVSKNDQDAAKEFLRNNSSIEEVTQTGKPTEILTGFWRKKAEQFAKGGYSKDTVPAMLTPGEFVINKKAAAKIGSDQLHKMNNADKIQGFNRGGSVGFIQRFAGGGTVDDPAVLDVFKDAAEKAGLTLEKFSKQLRDASKQKYQENREAIKNTRADIKTNLVQTRVKGLNSEDDIQNFQRELSGQLTGILGDNISGERLQDALDEIAVHLMDGKSFPELIKIVPELASAFDETTDQYRANFQVQAELNAEYGGLIKAVKVSQKELDDIDWAKAGGGKDLGILATIANKAQEVGVGGGARSLADSKIGKGLSTLQSKYDNFGKNMVSSLNKTSPLLAKAAGGIAGFSKAIGGLPVLLGGVTSVLADQFMPGLLKAAGIAETEFGAGLQGAVTEGANQAAAAAAMGAMINPAVGAIAGVVGAISGAVDGFIQAARNKKLELAINKLNATMEMVDKSFSDYETVKSLENLNRVRTNVADAELARQNVEAQGYITGEDRLNAGLGSALKIGTITTVLVGAAVAMGTALTGGLLLLPLAAAGIAGLGTALSLTTDELNNQALEAGLASLGDFFESLEKLARIDLKTKSIAELDDALNKLKNNDLSGSPILEEAKKLEGLDLTDEDVFRQAASQRIYQQSGGNVDLYREMMKNTDDDELLEAGRKIIKQKSEQLINEQRQATLLRDVNIEVENLVDKFEKINAVIKAVRSDLDELDKSVSDTMASIGGEGRVREASRRDSNILNNTRGYSRAEVSAAAARAGALIGGESGSQARQAVESKRILDEELPKILAGANSQNVDEVVEKIDQALAAGSIDRNTNNQITTDLRKALESKIGSRQGISLDELSEDVPALVASMKALDEQTKAAAAASELFADAMDQSTKYANEYIKALDEARQRELTGILNKIEGENRLAEAVGKRLTMEQRAASFYAEFDSLAGEGFRDGGKIDIAKVIAERERTRGQIDNLETEKAGTQDPQRLIELQEQLAELNATDANLVKSLEFVADSNALLTAALDRLAQQRELENKQVDFVTNLATSTPEEIAGISADISALNVALSGDRETRSRFFQSRENREDAFQGLNAVTQFLGTDDRDSRQIAARAQLNVLETMPGMQEILDLRAPGSGKTTREILEERARGAPTAEEQQAQEAIRLQQEANAYLEEIKNAQAEFAASKISDPIVTAIAQLPAAIAKAIADQQTAGGAGGRTAGAGGGAGTAGTKVTPGASVPTVAGASSRVGDTSIPLTAETQSELERARYEAQSVRMERQKMSDAIAKIKKLDETLGPGSAYEKELEKIATELGYEKGFLGGYFDSEGQGVGGSTGLIEDLEARYLQVGSSEAYLAVERRLAEIEQRAKAEREAAAAFLPPDNPYAPPEYRGPADLTIPSFPGMDTSAASGTPLQIGLGGVDISGIVSTLTNIDGSLTSIAAALSTSNEVFTALQTYLSTVSVPLVLDAESTAVLTTFNNKFGEHVDKLASLSLPDTISIVARHTVTVDIRGAEIFGQLEEDMQRLVVLEVNRELNRQTDGQLGSNYQP